MKTNRKIVDGFLAVILILGIGSVVTSPTPALSAGKHVTAARSTAGRSDFGLGIVLGDPTALSGKLWLSSDTAVDFAFGYSYGNSALLMSDFLWHRGRVFGSSTPFLSQLTGYIGVGGLLVLGGDKAPDSNVALGARVPLGLEWMPGDPSLGVFLEFAPGLRLITTFGGLFTGGAGVRYYF